MTIAGKTILVTGANRGIGRALVQDAPAGAPRGSMPTRASPWPTRMGGSCR
jgi:hypothetical protein